MTIETETYILQLFNRLKSRMAVGTTDIAVAMLVVATINYEK